MEDLPKARQQSPTTLFLRTLSIPSRHIRRLFSTPRLINLVQPLLKCILLNITHRRTPRSLWAPTRKLYSTYHPRNTKRQLLFRCTQFSRSHPRSMSRLNRHRNTAHLINLKELPKSKHRFHSTSRLRSPRCQSLHRRRLSSKVQPRSLIILSTHNHKHLRLQQS